MLVTGRVGFISSIYVRILSDGSNVICLDDFVTEKKGEYISFNSQKKQFVEGDIQKLEDCTYAISL